MSFKSKLVSVFASALVLGSLSIAASAQDPVPAVKEKTEKAGKMDGRGFGRHGGFERGHRAGKMGGMRGLMGVELTEAQKAQIKQIHEANKPDQTTVDEMKAINEARRAGALTEDQKARGKVLRDQMRAKSEAAHQQVLAILSPEQLKQIEARKAEMKQRMEERRQLREKSRQQAAPQVTTTKSTDN